MTFAIRGLGTALPATRLTQEEALGLARVLCCRTPEQTTWVPLMYAGTGIRGRNISLPRQLVEDVLRGTRLSGSVFLPSGEAEDSGPSTAARMALYAEHAGPLALSAALRAMEEARLPAHGITHLVTVSCTGFAAPGVDLALIEGLKLSPEVARTHVGFMGCHGAINGLRVAGAFTQADPRALVLLCAVELCSLHYHYGWDPQKIVANALFGDGAAALLADSTGQGWRLAACGSCWLPDSASAMTWEIGDHGFAMTLSRQVPRLIYEHLRPWLQDWLGRLNRSLADIRSWVIHPGGPKILDAVQEGLNLPDEALSASRAVFAEQGNMSSPTILFILDRLRRAAAPRPCLALAFGPGLAAEAALFV